MKIKRVKHVIGTAIFALFFTGISYGQAGQRNQEPPTVDEIFKQMDKDEDRKLSKKEVKGPLKNDFDKIDTNEDGYISKEEMEKAPKPKRGQKR